MTNPENKNKLNHKKVFWLPQKAGTTKNVKIISKEEIRIPYYFLKLYINKIEEELNCEVIGITFDDDGYLEFVVEVN